MLNRAGFNDLAGRQLQRCTHDRQPVSVLVMDLDHFKSVNDHYGHDGGDALLRAFCDVARAALRPSDLLGRAGGEEFWVLLPRTRLDEARRSAQRICDQFGASRLRFEEREIEATVSVGVAEVVSGESLQSMLIRADRALYDAKRQGRSRVIAAGSEPCVPMVPA